MRLPFALAALLLLAGCTSTLPDDAPTPPTLGFVAGRVDLDGDGLYDAVNLTLLAAPAPIEAARLAFTVDGETTPAEDLLPRGAWRPGTGVVLRCTPGVHEFAVRVDGQLKKVVVLECGVRAPKMPPFFQGRVVDGDADGRLDGIELTLLGGGPVPPETLTASLDDLVVRLYENPLKGRLARAPIANGSRVFTPCHPDHETLQLTWRSQALPPLRLTGCERFVAGVDAPLSIGAIDLDRDGVQDAWNLTLGATVDGPFVLDEVRAAWANQSASLNASSALEPPPHEWAAGQTLVATCPQQGTRSFTLSVRHVVVFTSVTVCDDPPGQPLIELSLAEDGGHLLATLELSRLDTLPADNVTVDGSASIGEGPWPIGETRALACPGGTLTLYVGERLAFRGASPC